MSTKPKGKGKGKYGTTTCISRLYMNCTHGDLLIKNLTGLCYSEFLHAGRNRTKKRKHRRRLNKIKRNNWRGTTAVNPGVTNKQDKCSPDVHSSPYSPFPRENQRWGDCLECLKTSVAKLRQNPWLVVLEPGFIHDYLDSLTETLANLSKHENDLDKVRWTCMTNLPSLTHLSPPSWWYTPLPIQSLCDC